MEIEIVKEISKCEKLWKSFSPKISLFDIWEFRFAFYEAYRYQPYFICLKENGEIKAILPLWYEDDQNRYTFFGGEWMEENRFLTKDFNYIPELLKNCPVPAYLIGIKVPKSAPNCIWNILEKDEPKCIVILKGIEKVSDYLKTLRKNWRKSMKKDVKRIVARNVKVIVNNFSDFEKLVELSKKRIVDADWNDPRRKRAFENILKIKNIQLRMLSYLIEDRIAGVDLIAIFNDCYYTLKCGYDVENFSGIGNFANYYNIKDAINLKMKRVDFLQRLTESSKWKSNYFQEVPLYKYVKS
jgi:hypothetical protein